jgi:hypothetical protein
MSLLLPLFLACATGPFGAPEGSTIEVSANLASGEYVMDSAYTDPADGVGLLIKEFALVQLPATSNVSSLPGNNILVEITSGYSGAYVLPESAVNTVDDYATECEGDLSEDCAKWFYDVGSQTYVEFAGDYADLGGFRPTYLAGETDGRGILDFYVFIDGVPLDEEGGAIDISYFASIGVDITSWSYSFGE